MRCEYKRSLYEEVPLGEMLSNGTGYKDAMEAEITLSFPSNSILASTDTLSQILEGNMQS